MPKLIYRKVLFSTTTRLCKASFVTKTLIERNPPPRGGFVFTMFPDQEPCGRGPPSKNLVQIFRGGSSYTRLLIREHSKHKTPPGGGVSFDQSFCGKRHFTEPGRRRKEHFSINCFWHFLSASQNILPKK